MNSLEELRRANIARQAEWCPDQTPDLSFRGNELAGEVGEACNIIKKLERERHGWRGSRSTLVALAEELADILICVDLIALQGGIDLGRAVAEKFNATSRANALATMMTHPLATIAVPEIMPEPTTLIDYGMGCLGMAMFHYAGEGDEPETIAREHGFEIRSLDLANDTEAGDLQDVFADKLDIDLTAWNPLPPAGWSLGGRYIGEDGPIVLFVRPIHAVQETAGSRSPAAFRAPRASSANRRATSDCRCAT